LFQLQANMILILILLLIFQKALYGFFHNYKSINIDCFKLVYNNRIYNRNNNNNNLIQLNNLKSEYNNNLKSIYSTNNDNDGWMDDLVEAEDDLEDAENIDFLQYLNEEYDKLKGYYYKYYYYYKLLL